MPLLWKFYVTNANMLLHVKYYNGSQYDTQTSLLKDVYTHDALVCVYELLNVSIVDRFVTSYEMIFRLITYLWALPFEMLTLSAYTKKSEHFALSKEHYVLISSITSIAHWVKFIRLLYGWIQLTTTFKMKTPIFAWVCSDNKAFKHTHK